MTALVEVTTIDGQHITEQYMFELGYVNNGSYASDYFI